MSIPLDTSNVPKFDLKAAAGRGHLLPEEAEWVLEIYTWTPQFSEIASILRLPLDLVRSTILVPANLQKALSSKACQAKAALYGPVLENLTTIASAEGPEAVAAARLLRQLVMDLVPPVSPSDPPAPSAPGVDYANMVLGLNG